MKDGKFDEETAVAKYIEILRARRQYERGIGTATKVEQAIYGISQRMRDWMGNHFGKNWDQVVRESAQGKSWHRAGEVGPDAAMQRQRGAVHTWHPDLVPIEQSRLAYPGERVQQPDLSGLPTMPDGTQVTVAGSMTQQGQPDIPRPLTPAQPPSGQARPAQATPVPESVTQEVTLQETAWNDYGNPRHVRQQAKERGLNTVGRSTPELRAELEDMNRRGVGAVERLDKEQHDGTYDARKQIIELGIKIPDKEGSGIKLEDFGTMNKGLPVGSWPGLWKRNGMEWNKWLPILSDMLPDRFHQNMQPSEFFDAVRKLAAPKPLTREYSLAEYLASKQPDMQDTASGRPSEEMTDAERQAFDDEEYIPFSTLSAEDGAVVDYLVQQAGGDPVRAWQDYERTLTAAAQRGEPVDQRKADAMRRALLGDPQQGDMFGEATPEPERRSRFVPPPERPVQQSLEGMDDGMLFSTFSPKEPPSPGQKGWGSGNMSLRAEQALAEGKHTASMIAQEYGLKPQTVRDMLRTREYHHILPEGRKTPVAEYFYEFDPKNDEVDAAKLAEMRAREKGQKTEVLQKRTRTVAAKKLGLKHNVSSGVVTDAEGSLVGTFRPWGFDTSFTTNPDAARQIAEVVGLNRGLDGNYYTEENSHPKRPDALKGTEAMEQVISEQVDASQAMWHPLVGDISFYWGNPGTEAKGFHDGHGVSHIIAARNAQSQDGIEAARHMVRVIAEGQVGEPRGPEGGQRIEITLGEAAAILSLYKHGDKETWLLTGWKETAPDETGESNNHQSYTRQSSGGRTDVGARANTTIPQPPQDVKDRGEDTRFSVAGPQGIGPVPQDVRDMHERGMHRRVIWQRSGWWQGPDGKWRFEIDDSKMYFHNLDMYRDPDTGNIRTFGKLPQKINYPELFQAYPALENAILSIDIHKGAQPSGAFSESPVGNGRHVLQVVAPNEAEARKVAIHEIQHGIQREEGFARGSSLEKAGSLVARRNFLDGEASRLAKEIDSAVTDSARSRLEQEFSDVQDERKTLPEVKESEYSGTNEMNIYQRTSGEVEARMVMDRLNMTPEQRKAEPPWQTMEPMLRNEGLLKDGQKPEDVMLFSTSDMRRIPKKYHDRIGSISDERADGNGIWVDLADGWIDPINETHSIHEDTWSDVVKSLKFVEREGDEKFSTLSPVTVIQRGVRGNEILESPSYFQDAYKRANPGQMKRLDKWVKSQPEQVQEYLERQKNYAVRDMQLQEAVASSGRGSFETAITGKKENRYFDRPRPDDWKERSHYRPGIPEVDQARADFQEANRKATELRKKWDTHARAEETVRESSGPSERMLAELRKQEFIENEADNRYKNALLDNGMRYSTATVEALEQRLRDQYGVDITLFDNQIGDIRMQHIAVHPDKRKQGIGSSVMRDLTAYADTHGKRLVLQTGVQDRFSGTTSAARLKRFYKRFGFVENKGRNKDYRISENMIRNPKTESIDTPQFSTLAPNGKPSNLNPFAHRQVRTPEFKRWFGDWEIAAAKVERKAKTFSEAQQAFTEFWGKDIKNEETGLIGRVSKRSVDKMLNDKAVSKSVDATIQSMAVANLDSLYKRSRQGWSKPDKNKDPNIKAIHRFFAPMIIDDKAYLTKITVREIADASTPNKIYSVESVDFNEKTPAAEWVAASAKADGIDLTSTRSVGDILSIAQDVENYNPSEVSVVVDENGEPLVVYHGTGGQDFTIPNTPMWFTSSTESANAYTQTVDEQLKDIPRKSARIYPVYLSLKNPIFVPSQMRMMEIATSSPWIHDLQESGYDGLVLKGHNGQIDVAVAFTPTQIKSVNNQGTFSDSPNMMFSTLNPDNQNLTPVQRRYQQAAFTSLIRHGNSDAYRREMVEQYGKAVEPLLDQYAADWEIQRGEVLRMLQGAVRDQQSGQRRIGRPDLANPGTTPEARDTMRRVDRARNLDGQPGVRSDEQVEARAQELLRDPDALEAHIHAVASTEDQLNDAETRAARALFNQLHAQAVASGNQRDLERAIAFGNAYRDTGSEQARAFRQRQVPRTTKEKANWLRDTLLGPSRKQQEMLDKQRTIMRDKLSTTGVKQAAQRRIDRINKDISRSVQKRLDWMQRNGWDLSEEGMEVIALDQQLLHAFMRDVATDKASFADKVHEFRLSMMLSAPPTHIVNVLSSQAHATWEMTLQRGVEASINTFVQDPTAAQWGEFKYMFKAAMNPSVWKHAMQNAMLAMDLEAQVLSPKVKGELDWGSGWAESYRGPAIKGKLGRAIRVPLRLLLFEDELH